jgi:DNA-binding transcriptional LysR family regulator
MIRNKPFRLQKKRLISRLRPSQLELLAAMDRTETLSAAAREVNLSQPAASRLLRELSSDLKVALFERVGRSLHPTAAGKALIRNAVSLIADLDRTQQEIEAIRGGLIGAVSIGSGVSSCYVLIPAALGLLLKTSPRISVTIKEGPMDDLLAKLRAGQIDILVGRFRPEEHTSDIKTEDLYCPNVRAVCGRDNPLAARQSITWDDLCGQSWILPESGTAMRAAIEGQFRKQRRRPAHAFIESSSIQANVALLNSSNLVWVLSSDVAMYFSNLSLLHVLNVPELAAPSAFVMAYLKSRTLSPGAEHLAHCLRVATKK